MNVAETATEFTCAECDGTFDKAWSDEEAMEENRRLFGEPDDDLVVICDDCFKKMVYG
jgi:hypothetical protein